MNPTTHLETICVVGLGYIGLPTAAVLAQVGKKVIGVDVKASVVDAVNAGEVPFAEEGLEAVLAGVVAKGHLHAQHEVPEADAYIVSVPTPFAGNHEADLSHVEDAARAIASRLKPGGIVILESTTPPGATEHMSEVILDARPDLTSEVDLPNSVYFAHAPERVLPGRIMIEILENDRIIGGTTPEAAALARDLYASFCRGKLLLTDARTAEMAKLTENAFRDVNIAFANELSIIADRQGIDVWELIELANHHPRVNILSPGPGVGGHCIAVDPWFIVAADRENSRLIATARRVNDSKPEFVLQMALAQAERFSHPVIAAVGITFKANVDDLRESPSKFIAGAIADRLENGTVLVVDPHVSTLPPEFEERDNMQLTELDSALERADIVLVLVDHDVFSTIERSRLEEKVLIDTKGIWRTR